MRLLNNTLICHREEVYPELVEGAAISSSLIEIASLTLAMTLRLIIQGSRSIIQKARRIRKSFNLSYYFKKVR